MPNIKKSKEAKAVPIPISVSVKHKSMLIEIKDKKGWGNSEIYAKALELFYKKLQEDKTLLE